MLPVHFQFKDKKPLSYQTAFASSFCLEKQVGGGKRSAPHLLRGYTIFNSVLLFHFETFLTNFPSSKSSSSRYSSIRKWMISDSRKKSPFFMERVNALSLSRCAWSGFTRTFCINFFINFILVRPCSYILYTCSKEYKSLVDD